MVCSIVVKREQKNLIYISGQITENPNYRDDFFEAEAWLTEQGYDVINPSNLDLIIPSLTYEQYMSIDYKLIELADGIFMMHNWQKSKGACAELCFAKSIGKKILYQDYFGRKRKQ